MEQWREQFEEAAYKQYFISSIQRIGKPPFELQPTATKNKAEFTAKDEQGNYLDNDLNFAWWGYREGIAAALPEPEPAQESKRPAPR